VDPTTTTVTNGLTTAAQSSTGSDKGAVFTFTTGYNFVWNSWVLGVQSEVSYNRTKVLLQGPSGSTSSSVETRNTITDRWTGPHRDPLRAELHDRSEWSSNRSNNPRASTQLDGIGDGQDWIFSNARLARLWAGWLELGRREVDQTLPYTLSGFTYGGGIERDFGWLRGFIQVKTINYREKSIMETLRTANDRAENS